MHSGPAPWAPAKSCGKWTPWFSSRIVRQAPAPHPQCDQGLGYNRDIMSRTLASKPNPIAQYLPTGRASPSLA